MTAKDILELLRERHAEDVFVSECKDGPTQSVSHYLRMDAWIMRRSWSKPLVIAYEIKVSRQDFLRDDKHLQYLDYCNEFYFVSPPDVISPTELQPEVGLLWTSTHGKKLFMKKRATVRDVKIPETLWRYILMARATIVGEREIDERHRMRQGRIYWEEWLQAKKANRELAYRVGKKIRSIVEEVRSENRKLRHENEELQEIKQMILDAGIKDIGWSGKALMGRYLETVTKGLSADLLRMLRETHWKIDALLKEAEGKSSDNVEGPKNRYDEA